LAVVKLQADMGLGRSYSAMLPLVEGLHIMGYLSDEDYEEAKAQYSVGLLEASKKPLTISVSPGLGKYNGIFSNVVSSL